MTKNAKDFEPDGFNILMVGPPGAGKTAQIWTLPGKVFVYVFDPNALRTLKGCDLDYETFLPDNLELDATIKGFNKGSKDDRPASRVEPRTYNNWVEHITQKAEEGFFEPYDWVCIDSVTFLQKACMDRNLYLNNRFGKVEDLSDYRVVGSKLSDVFRSLTSEQGINIYCTGHVDEWQDEKTKKITTQLRLHGQARTTLPLMFSDVLLATNQSDEKAIKYTIQTRPLQRGLQSIRTSIPELEMFEDVTIPEFSDKSKEFGLGKLLTR